MMREGPEHDAARRFALRITLLRDTSGRAGARLECPDSNLLAGFAEGALVPEERDLVVAHLGECGDCARHIAVALAEVKDLAAWRSSASSVCERLGGKAPSQRSLPTRLTTAKADSLPKRSREEFEGDTASGL